MSRTFKDQPYRVRYQRAVKNVDSLKNQRDFTEVVYGLELNVVFKPDEVDLIEAFADIFSEEFEADITRREVFGYVADPKEPLEPYFRWGDQIAEVMDNFPLPMRSVYLSKEATVNDEPYTESSLFLICPDGTRYRKTKVSRPDVYEYSDDPFLPDGSGPRVKLTPREQMVVVMTARFKVEAKLRVFRWGGNFVFSDENHIGRCNCPCCREPYSYRDLKSGSTPRDKSKFRGMCKSFKNGLDEDNYFTFDDM